MLACPCGVCSCEDDQGEGQPAGSTAASRDGSPGPAQLFYGPRSLDMTAMKYMSPFKEAEETDGNVKCPRLQPSVSHVSAQSPRSCAVPLPYVGQGEHHLSSMLPARHQEAGLFGTAASKAVSWCSMAQ